MKRPAAFRRFFAVAIVGVVVLLVGAAAGWSAETVFNPGSRAVRPATFTLAQVMNGEVGSSLNLTATAQWIPKPSGWNRANGTVTTVNINPGQLVSAGDVLFTVNLRPVTVAVGEIPAFEHLIPGQKGADVVQLQRLLNSRGLLKAKPTGIVDGPTVSAVKAWQRELGIFADGIVEVGDIIYVPALPARVLLDSTVIKVGAGLTGGEPAIELIPSDPSFTIAIDASQAALTPVGTEVDITAGEATWRTLIKSVTTEEKIGTTVLLKGLEGGSVCAPDCSRIPFVGTASLPAKVLTVPTATGLTVPSAALTTDASGRTNLFDRKGKKHPVDVVSSARGLSLIKGVPEGMMVRLPGSAG